MAVESVSELEQWKVLLDQLSATEDHDDAVSAKATAVFSGVAAATAFFLAAIVSAGVDRLDNFYGIAVGAITASSFALCASFIGRTMSRSVWTSHHTLLGPVTDWSLQHRIARETELLDMNRKRLLRRQQEFTRGISAGWLTIMSMLLLILVTAANHDWQRLTLLSVQVAAVTLMVWYGEGNARKLESETMTCKFS